jgi:hypothetical protein
MGLSGLGVAAPGRVRSTSVCTIASTRLELDPRLISAHDRDPSVLESVTW